MIQPSLARSGPRLTGVIDTLSDGYGVVNRHPWIVLIPVLLDLFLLLGPQYSAARLLSQAFSRALPAGSLSGATQMFDQTQQREWVQAAEEFNLLSGLAPSVVGVPSLIAALGIRDPLKAISVESWGLALVILFGSVFVGMLLGSLYYAIVAQEVRDGAVSLVRLLGQTFKSWLRVLLYLLLLGGLLALFGLPTGLLAVSAASVSPVLGSLALSAVMMALIWAGIYLFFVPDAIFLSQVGPLQAVKNSVAVVRGYFWAAVGIVILITLVLVGMARVWELVLENVTGPWGLGLGILGNAYIASGLVAASMRFYRERIEVLRPAPAVQTSGERAELAGSENEPDATERNS